MEELHQPGNIIAERYRIIDTLGQGGNGIDAGVDSWYRFAFATITLDIA